MTVDLRRLKTIDANALGIYIGGVQLRRSVGASAELVPELNKHLASALERRDYESNMLLYPLAMRARKARIPMATVGLTYQRFSAKNIQFQFGASWSEQVRGTPFVYVSEGLDEAAVVSVWPSNNIEAINQDHRLFCARLGSSLEDLTAESPATSSWNQG